MANARRTSTTTHIFFDFAIWYWKKKNKEFKRYDGYVMGSVTNKIWDITILRLTKWALSLEVEYNLRINRYRKVQCEIHSRNERTKGLVFYTHPNIAFSKDDAMDEYHYGQGKK